MYRTKDANRYEFISILFSKQVSAGQQHTNLLHSPFSLWHIGPQLFCSRKGVRVREKGGGGMGCLEKGVASGRLREYSLHKNSSTCGAPVSHRHLKNINPSQCLCGKGYCEAPIVGLGRQYNNNIIYLMPCGFNN